MNDLRHSSDADASSDFSSLSEMDSLQRDVLSGDYDSDQELPLGGRWDLAAHWHLIGDYSEGVEGDADDDDEEERDVDTDLSEGPAGPTTRSGIYLDLSRVHDILSSIPSSTPLDPSPSDSSMRASTLAGELAEAAYFQGFGPDAYRKPTATACTAASHITESRTQLTEVLLKLTVKIKDKDVSQTEEWDVKVTITAVDYDAGAVYGLMEAMDVPMSSSNVVTFWEGEIIDFENHTFWTRKWTAKARTDVEHWKRLEAFQGLDERHIIRGAKTGKFRGHIDQKYIFMRWKEKHFVNISEHTSEHTSGLTIAGFYYLSMRRSDGFVEGYYHDQQSTPFQHLTLRPTFEATGFSSPVFEVA
ncbi:hypothetical protein BGX28_008017 [Mortierella sp. GBA30]|nr:hypothetical protein BGX28_008017 [Mortierella sp. GBA30]